MSSKEKILKYKTFQKNFIYASVFESVPKRLFICIWPANSDVPYRAQIGIRRSSMTILNPKTIPKHLQKCPEAAPYELFLRPTSTLFLRWVEQFGCILKLNKTANHFDSEQFCWQGAAGHRLELQRGEFAHDGTIVFRAQDPRMSNKKFLQMLAVIGEKYQGEEVLLQNYIETNFPLASYGSYSMAIYLAVPFEIREDTFGQKLYQFAYPDCLPESHLEITSFLYETEDETSLKKTEKNTVALENSSTVSVSNVAPLQEEAELKMDLQSIVKNVLQKFDRSSIGNHYDAIAQEIVKEMMHYYGHES